MMFTKAEIELMGQTYADMRNEAQDQLTAANYLLLQQNDLVKALRRKVELLDYVRTSLMELGELDGQPVEAVPAGVVSSREDSQ